MLETASYFQRRRVIKKRWTSSVARLYSRKDFPWSEVNKDTSNTGIRGGVDSRLTVDPTPCTVYNCWIPWSSPFQWVDWSSPSGTGSDGVLTAGRSGFIVSNIVREQSFFGKNVHNYFFFASYIKYENMWVCLVQHYKDHEGYEKLSEK